MWHPFPNYNGKGATIFLGINNDEPSHLPYEKGRQVGGFCGLFKVQNLHLNWIRYYCRTHVTCWISRGKIIFKFNYNICYVPVIFQTSSSMPFYWCSHLTRPTLYLSSGVLLLLQWMDSRGGDFGTFWHLLQVPWIFKRTQVMIVWDTIWKTPETGKFSLLRKWVIMSWQ